MNAQIQTLDLNATRAGQFLHRAMPILVCIALCMPLMTMAGTDTTFDNIATMVSGWLTGSLGKVLALIGLAIALGSGLIKGSAMGVVFGLAVALAAVYGPGILTSMFSATF